MKRVEIIAKGKVQRVGYRDIVLDIARDTNITGYVENLKPHDVRIVCEGEEKDLERFIDLIKINKYAINVKDVEFTFQEPMGEFEYFEIRRGEWKEEQGERMDTAVKYLFTNIELSERSVQLGERSVEIGEKMLEKQDQMLDKQDQMIGKQDQMLGKQDQTIGSIENLRGDMGQRFNILDDKYGEINKNIQRAIESIDLHLERSDKTIEVFKTTMEGLLKELIDARKGGTN